MKTKLTFISILSILTLWTNKIYGQCDAQFIVKFPTVCQDEPVLIENSSTTTSGSPTYFWTFQGQEFTGETPEIYPLYDESTYGPNNVILYLTDGPCTDTDTFLVHVDRSPKINLQDTAICDTVNGTRLFGGYLANSNWEVNGNFVSDSYYYMAKEPGEYVLWGDNGVCTSYDTCQVHMGTIPQPDLGDDIEACGSTTIKLQNPPFLSYLWNTGETGDSITTDTSGIYSIGVTNNDCPGYDTIQVICHLLPTVQLPDDTTVVIGSTIPLTPNGVYAVQPITDASGIKFSGTKNVSTTNGFSLGIIIRPSEKSFNYYGGLISQGNGARVDSMNFIWFLKPDKTFELQLRNNKDSIILHSQSKIKAGSDYLLVATIDPLEGIKMYINGVLDTTTQDTITIQTHGSLNILRSFNEQYNPTLGHCSVRDAIATGAFIWNTPLNVSDIISWFNDVSLLPQEQELSFELWFKDNKGNTATNMINGEKGRIYDLKKWKANFPFSDQFNPYQQISWNTGLNDYGIEFQAESSNIVSVTVTDENLCESSDSIAINVEDSVSSTNNYVYIHYQDGTPVTQGRVKLWGFTNHHKILLTMVDIINGYANFGDLEAGAYALHIIGIPGYHSFFYENSHNIQGAHIIILYNDETMNLEIEIPRDPPLKRNKNDIVATVSGYLHYSSTGKGRGIWKSKSNSGDPIPYEVVELNQVTHSALNWNDSITWYQTFMSATTNEDGYFEITDIPLGEYILYPNMSQYDTIKVDPYAIEVTSTDTIFENMNYQVDTSSGTSYGTTNVEAKTISDGIEVYPNPAQDYITIDLGNNKIAEIKIYNILGKRIYQKKIINKTRINLSSYPRGFYLLKIKTEREKYSRKIILE